MNHKPRLYQVVKLENYGNLVCLISMVVSTGGNGGRPPPEISDKGGQRCKYPLHF